MSTMIPNLNLVLAQMVQSRGQQYDVQNQLKLSEYRKGFSNWLYIQRTQPNNDPAPAPPKLTLFDQTIALQIALNWGAMHDEELPLNFAQAIKVVTAAALTVPAPPAPPTVGPNPLGPTDGPGKCAALSGDGFRLGSTYTDANGTVWTKTCAQTPFGVESWWQSGS